MGLSLCSSCPASDASTYFSYFFVLMKRVKLQRLLRNPSISFKYSSCAAFSNANTLKSVQLVVTVIVEPSHHSIFITLFLHLSMPKYSQSLLSIVLLITFLLDMKLASGVNIHLRTPWNVTQTCTSIAPRACCRIISFPPRSTLRYSHRRPSQQPHFSVTTFPRFMLFTYADFSGLDALFNAIAWTQYRSSNVPISEWRTGCGGFIHDAGVSRDPMQESGSDVALSPASNECHE